MQYVLTSYVAGEDDEIVSHALPFGDAKTIFASTLKTPVEELMIVEGGKQSGQTPEGEEITLRPALADELLIADEENETAYVDDIVAEFSDEKLKIGFDRAVAEFGGIVADYDDEEFAAEFANQLKMMALKDVMNSLVANGGENYDHEATTLPDGEIMYSRVG